MDNPTSQPTPRQQLVTVPTRRGTRTFDLAQPILFKNRLFRPEEARAELSALDERSHPLVYEAAGGQWAIVVHCQEEPVL